MVAVGASYSSSSSSTAAAADGNSATKDGRGGRVDKYPVGANHHQHSKTPDQPNPDGHSQSLHSNNHPPAPPPLPPPLNSGGGTLRAPSRTDSESSPSSSSAAAAAGGSSSQTERLGPAGESGGGGAAIQPPLLPQQKIPQPRAPMKRLQWTKIPTARVASCPGNVWSEVACSCDGHRIDFDRLEELFSSSPGGGGSAGCSGFGGGTTGGRPKESSSVDGSSGHCEKKTKRTDEINLIDSKRSMNVNIFLRQFRTTNFDIIGCLRAGESSKMGPERLRSLLKILPEAEEVQLLQTFIGDRSLLGTAEKFYLELMSLPHHKLLAEALLMKEEFPSTIDYIKPAIDAIVLSARDIKDCKVLHEIMYAVVMAGNFLNSGVYSGNAAGFQLQSLLKLSDLRSNKPRLSLLHFVAQETEEKNPHLMEQLKGLKYLSEASQYSIELLLSEISTLQGRVRTISSQLTNCGWKFQEQLKRFLEMANAEMEVLEFDTKELEELRLELAAYFCEDVLTFKLDDCISTFNSFCKMFVKALEENKERRLQDMKAEERRRLREEQIASKRRLLTANESGKTAAAGTVGQTNNEVRHQNTTKTGDRRIASLSDTAPSFLQETSQPKQQTDDEHPTTGRAPPPHQKRNSESNLTNGGGPRRTWPSAPPATAAAAAADADDPAGQNELLLNALLKAATAAASAADETDRRPGSQRLRRRSRASVDAFYDLRERASSPAADISDGIPGKNQSSIPPMPPPPPPHHRYSSCPGVTAGPPGAEDSESPGVSDVEANAKQEREDRRMERRRRSQRANSSVTAPCLISTEANRVSIGHPPAPPPPPQTPQEPEKTRDQRVEKETATENREITRSSFVTAGKRPNSGNKTDRRSVCDRKSATTRKRTVSSASKSEPQNNSLPGSGSTVKKTPSSNDNSHKPRPSSSAASKTGDVVVSRTYGLQKGCADAQKTPKMQSNRRSEESVPRGNKKRQQEKSKTGDWMSVQTDGTPSNIINAGEIVNEVSFANGNSFPPGHSSSSGKNDVQKAFVPTEGDEEAATSGCREKESAHPSGADTRDGSCEYDGSQSIRLNTEVVVDYGDEEEEEEEEEDELPTTKSPPPSDLTALDSVAVFLYDTSTTEPPPPLPPPPDDDGLGAPSSPSKFSRCDASSKPAVYRDEGIDMDAASLSSSSAASQRTSLCSTVELDVRVTPPMVRKDYDDDEDGGQREGRSRGASSSAAVPPAARTSSIEKKTVVSKRCSSSSRNEASPRDSNKRQATPKNQMASSAAAKTARASRDVTNASGKTTKATMTTTTTMTKSFLAENQPHKSPGVESNIKIQQKTTTTKSKTSPTAAAAAAAAAVRYKIAKPNFVSCSGDVKEGAKSSPAAAAGVRASSSATSTSSSGRNAANILSPKSKAVFSVKRPMSVSVVTGGPATRPTAATATATAAKSAISAQKKKAALSSSTDEKRPLPIGQNSQQQQQQQQQQQLAAKKLPSQPAIADVPPGEIVATPPGNSLGALTGGDPQKRRGVVETATQRSTRKETTNDTRRVLSHSAIGSSRNVSFVSVLGSKRSSRSEIHATP